MKAPVQAAGHATRIDWEWAWVQGCGSAGNELQCNARGSLQWHDRDHRCNLCPEQPIPMPRPSNTTTLRLKVLRPMYRVWEQSTSISKNKCAGRTMTSCSFRRQRCRVAHASPRTLSEWPLTTKSTKALGLCDLNFQDNLQKAGIFQDWLGTPACGQEDA